MSLISRASVRVRTTAAAVLVVAVVLLVGGVALVLLVRGSLRNGVEKTAQQRADALVEQIRTTGMPRSPSADDDDQEPEELVWQVLGSDGTVLAASQPLSGTLPDDDVDSTHLPDADHGYLVVTEQARLHRADDDLEDDDDDDEARSAPAVRVVVAASREDIDESTAALITPLAIGLPLVLLLVGGTTWVVVSRALAPVERIRREVDQITGDRLDRRVPEPTARDEVHRLARTMNQMLARLQTSRERQQQFVADASHELRSPLASIRQTAEVGIRHPDAMPEGELAEAVLTEAVRMQRLVEQLLLLTRADAGVAVPTAVEVDLDDLVLTAARRSVRDGVRIDTTGVSAGRVHGDEIALGQVVRNLIDNAVRHATSTVTLGVRETADGVELTVDDDGPGIPAADRDRVFERFVRLDEARARDAGGSGLGLAIVRDVVAAHRGQVRIEQASIGGARFVVHLPG